MLFQHKYMINVRHILQYKYIIFHIPVPLGGNVNSTMFQIYMHLFFSGVFSKTLTLPTLHELSEQARHGLSVNTSVFKHKVCYCVFAQRRFLLTQQNLLWSKQFLVNKQARFALEHLKTIYLRARSVALFWE